MKRYRSQTKVFTMCVVAGLSVLSYAFGVSCMNNALSQMLIVFNANESNKGFIQGLLQSSVYIGCFLGVCICTRILRFGNRVVFYVLDITIIVGAVMLWFDNLAIFSVGRLVMGLGSGVAPAATTSFVKEFCPRELYRTGAGIAFIIFSLGVLLTYIMGLFFQSVDDDTTAEQINNYWRYYFTVFPISICVIRMLLLHFHLRQDSPIYCLKTDNYDTARNVIASIYKPEYCQEVFDELLQESKSQLATPSVFDYPYKRRMMFSLCLMLMTTCCGYNAIVQYSSLIFQEVFSQQVSHWLTLSISLLKIVVYSIGIHVANKIGSRPLFVYGNLMMILTNLSIGILAILIDSDIPELNKSSLQGSLVALIFVFLIANFSSLTLFSGIYIPDIVPALGVHYSWVMFWLSQCILLFVFPIVKQLLGMGSCFLFFAAITLIGQFMIRFYLMDTRGATEEDIRKFYYPSQDKVSDPSVEDLLSNTI